MSVAVNYVGQRRVAGVAEVELEQREHTLLGFDTSKEEVTGSVSVIGRGLSRRWRA